MATGNPDPQVLQAILNAFETLAPPQTYPTTFALTPGQHKLDDIIDYSTKGGKALYEEGGSALKSSFDVEASHLVVFIKELTFHMKELEWSEGNQNNTKFDTTSTGITTTFDILTKWGWIPESDLSTICTKWGESGTHSNTRGAKNNSIMVKSLQTTFTNDASLLITPHIASVTVDSVVVAPLLF